MAAVEEPHVTNPDVRAPNPTLSLSLHLPTAIDEELTTELVAVTFSESLWHKAGGFTIYSSSISPTQQQRLYAGASDVSPYGVQCSPIDTYRQRWMTNWQPN